MSPAKRRARKPVGRRDLHEMERWRRVAIGGLALAGILVSGYLTASYFADASLICLVGSGCEVVRHSGYAKLGGVPVALFGLAGYGAILASLLGRDHPRGRSLVLYSVALTGFAFSSYLTFLELFVIKALCSYCLLSYGLISGVLALLLAPRPVLEGMPWRRYRALTVTLVAVAVLAPALLQASAGTSLTGEEESFATVLAKHLTKSGVVVYGAYWCPRCADQKTLFGDAYKYVNYVECDPKGKGGNPFLCAQKGIQGYPTWEIAGRLYPGVRSLEELARLSGFPGPGP